MSQNIVINPQLKKRRISKRVSCNTNSRSRDRKNRSKTYITYEKLLKNENMEIDNAIYTLNKLTVR